MSKEIISIIAPVLDADVSIGEALSRGRVIRAFGVVEHMAGKFRLHPLYSLEAAAQQGASAMLGSHAGRGLGTAPLPASPFWGGDSEDRNVLNSLNGDLAIRGLKYDSSGAMMRIIGFAEIGDYLPTVVRKVWYQCDASNCLDRTRYASPGTCGWAHPLKKKP